MKKRKRIVVWNCARCSNYYSNSSGFQFEGLSNGVLEVKKAEFEAQGFVVSVAHPSLDKICPACSQILAKANKGSRRPAKARVSIAEEDPYCDNAAKIYEGS